MEFIKCTRENPRILENGFIYIIPFSNSFTKCGVLKSVWKKCQDYRETEVYEEMRKMYVKDLKSKRM